MDGLSYEATETLRALRLLHKQKRLTTQQYKTLKGQVVAGNNEAAMKGLNKLLNRERRNKSKCNK